MKHLTIFVLSMAIFNGFSFGGNIQKNLELSASGIEIIDLDCGAGFLKVEGIKNLKNIELKAEIEMEGFDNNEIE